MSPWLCGNMVLWLLGAVALSLILKAVGDDRVWFGYGFGVLLRILSTLTLKKILCCPGATFRAVDNCQAVNYLPSQPGGDLGRRFALIIGNGQFADSRIPTLKKPGADAAALGAVLQEPRIGHFDDVITLVDHSSSSIRRALAKFFTNKQCEDLLLLYFSCHGMKDGLGNLYLTASDTESELLSGTAIPAAFVTQEMDRCNSKRKVLILDCCYSGAFASGAKTQDFSAGTACAFKGNGYGKVILTATDSTQLAWESE